MLGLYSPDLSADDIARMRANYNAAGITRQRPFLWRGEARGESGKKKQKLPLSGVGRERPTATGAGGDTTKRPND
jgi:hypothetical protein